MVILNIIGPANQTAGHRPFSDPQLQHQKQMQTYKRHQQTGKHEMRAPPMQRSNKPTEGYLGIQNLQAVPSLAGGGHIDEGEKNSSDNLEGKHSERGAAEDVKPACRLPRNGVLHRVADRRPE